MPRNTKTAAAIPSAAGPSLRSTLIPIGTSKRARHRVATTVSAASWWGGARSSALPLQNGADPKFSITTPAQPPDTSASASAIARSYTAAKPSPS